MAEWWKAWKSKGRISPLPTAPWKSRKEREISTFPQLRRLGHGKVENQKQVSHFPTAIYSQVEQNRPTSSAKKRGHFYRGKDGDISNEARQIGIIALDFLAAKPDTARRCRG